VTDRARLDSLFLDEGFGTLDPESLRIVVEAIEQLGGDGRLVGVVTHVRELAEQFARIEVIKSPRGSRIAFVG
jgi:exonuclease SbcC